MNEDVVRNAPTSGFPNRERERMRELRPFWRNVKVAVLLLHARAESESPMTSSDILTKRDVAELLQVSERTVERWISEGSIPYVPLPKRGA